MAASCSRRKCCWRRPRAASRCARCRCARCHAPRPAAGSAPWSTAWPSARISAGAGEVVSVVSGGRARERHAAIVEAAAPYAGGIGWAAVIGMLAARCAGGRLAWWWRHPRRRRATAAVTGVLGLPVVLPLLVLAALTGFRLPALRALVSGLYAQRRLHAEPATP